MSVVIDNVGSYDASVTISLFDHSPKYQPNSLIPNDGYIRTNYGKFEYWDGKSGCWLPYSGADINVSLGPKLYEIVEWAERKMLEERRLDELAEKYPALKTAKENFEIVKAMVENEL